ncbi:MAG: putative maltokinase, partial [Dehalococcoidia bacterium]
VAYFGEGDICQMAFHFPVMPRLFMAIHQEDRFPIVDIVRQTPAIPDNCQWAVFLRNHDELTLEMVTDEERDYMYRVYAADQRMRINLGIRRRLAPLLGNHRRRIELMNALLFALPGTPVLYYGDEIGMGDNVYLGDRNGVRTPMQWSGDRNAGFSRANPQKLFMPVIIDPEYHYETVNVEAQQQNQHSLLWWTKRLIALRRRYKAFGRGTMEFLHPENRKVLSFIRRLGDERILIVANLSRFAQGVSIDLSEFKGMVPVEMFGRVELPPITDQPYFFTLGPHSFFWISIEPQKVSAGRPHGSEAPVHVLSGGWEDLFDFGRNNVLASQLPDYLASQRWFSGKGRRVRSTSIEEAIPVKEQGQSIYLTMINVQYSEGVGETYMLPLTYASGEQAFQRIRQAPRSVVMRLKTKRSEEEAILYDAMYDEGFAGVCLRAIERRQHLKTERGELVGTRTNAFRDIGIERGGRVDVLRAEQTNTSINYGDRMIMKLFRRLEPGINPDLEIGRFLTAAGFKHSPRVTGAIEYRRGTQEPITLAVMNEYIVKESDAWEYTLDTLRDFLDKTMALSDEVSAPPPTASTFMRLSEEEPPPLAIETIGGFLESARLLGIRTAEMHAALGSGGPNSAFAAEPYTPHYLRGLYQSLRNMTTNNFGLLARYVRENESTMPEAAHAIVLEEQVLAHFRRLTGKQMSSSRIRAHGDYHLGQVLYTGNDFVITDFEGEPSRTITERRIRRSPLRDVSGMLRSFSYAVHTALQELRASGLEGAPEERARQWGRFWEAWVCSTFLRAYLDEAKRSKTLVADWAEIELLLDVFMLEKVVYEIGYELNNRPDWLVVPLSGLLEMVKTE